jgi:cytochrome c oxidase subunit 3
MAATNALPAAPPLQRPRVLVVGAAFASAAAVMIFVGLIGIYLAVRANTLATADTWLPTGLSIPLQQPNTILFTLLMSVATMAWAVQAVSNNDKVNSYLALAVTTVFGFSAILMTSYLYSLMGADITGNVQSVLIYTITGGWLIMLIIAIGFIDLMAFRALAGGFSARQHDGITAAAVFWYAMVAVYALIWIAIYVTK